MNPSSVLLPVAGRTAIATKFFEKVGYPSKEESVIPAAIETLLAVAPKYGIEIHLPPRSGA